MALAEEFEKTGNWLFRYRSFMPLVLFLIATLVIIFEKDELADFHNIYWNLGCYGISLLGLLIRAVTIGYTPRGTSGRNTQQGQIAESLNTKGIYSTVRHPLYLGNFFMWLGLILYVGTPWFIVFSMAFFWIYYERIMFAEEQFIRGKFGQQFLDWSARTPAFFPCFNRWQKPELTFSLRNVLKREYSGFFGNIFSFLYLNFIKNYFYDGQIWLDFKWQIAGSAGFIIFITLRSLKKYTKVLSVEGR
jgi:protein-S-isoprenylcysteine O-methyltransferase Ste14